MICGINLPGGKPCLENKWSCDRDGDRHLSSAPLVSNSFIAFHPFYKDGLIRLISPSFFLYILNKEESLSMSEISTNLEEQSTSLNSR